MTGNAKLPLKPNRAPYQFQLFPKKQEERIWSDFYRDLGKFISSSIIDIVENDLLTPDPAILWDLIDVNNFSLDGLNKNWVYLHLPIPFSSNDYPGLIEWTTLQQLYSKKVHYITINADLPKERQSKNIPLTGINLRLCSNKKISNEVMKIVRATTVLTIDNRQVLYEINPGIDEFNKIDDTQFIESLFSRMDLQKYSKGLKEYIAVNNAAKSANILHPVIQYLLKTSSDQNKWFRWGIFFIANEIVNDRDFDEKTPKLWGKNTIGNVNIAISHLKKVNWNEIPDNIKPPYKIFYPDSGNIHEISLEYLIEKLNETGVIIKEEKPHKVDLS